MKPLISMRYLGCIAATLLLGLSLTGSTQNAPARQRTIRDNQASEKKTVDLDAAISELERGRRELDKTLQDGEWKKQEAELREALKKAETQLAAARADMDKARRELEAVRLKGAAAATPDQADLEGLKQAMEKIREVDLAKVRDELERSKPEIERSLQETRVQLDKAKIDLKEYKVFIHELEKEGLIDPKEGYTIEHRNGRFIINGQAQPESVYERHRSFLQQHRDIRLRHKDNVRVRQE